MSKTKKYLIENLIDRIMFVFLAKRSKFAKIQKYNTMGKGDRRTRRGKIFAGTYGKSRPRKLKKANKAKKADNN